MRRSGIFRPEGSACGRLSMWRRAAIWSGWWSGIPKDKPWRRATEPSRFLEEVRVKLRYLALFLPVLASNAQNTPPVDSGVVIRAEARQVLVDAVVTDKKGGYVRDLEIKDFKVWEDNKEQTIKSFSYEADPKAPTHGRTHYMVLFFDNAGMEAADQVRARQAAVRFIDANAGPDRMIAILNYGGGPQLNFTSNAERLKSVVGGTALPVTGQTEGSTGPALNLSGGCGWDVVMELRCVAKRLASIPGRKSLIWITAGFKVTPEILSESTATIDACNKANVAIYAIDVRGLVAPAALVRPLPSSPLSAYLRPAFFAPQRGGGGGGAPGGSGGAGAGRGGGGGPVGGPVGGGAAGGRGAGGFGNVNPGANGGREAAGGRGPAGPGAPNGPGGRGAAAPAPMIPGLNPYNQSRELIPKIPDSATDNQNIMFILADGTGGFVIHDSNDLLAGLQKIGSEQNEYYLIGYTPPMSAEGSCHVLRVKVDRGGTTVRARTGYCNAKPQDLLSGNPIEKTLESKAAASQAGSIAANMQLPFFYTSSNVARVNVAMEIAADQIKFEKVKGKQHGEVNVLGIAYTPEGGVGARFSDTVKLDFEDKKEAEAFQKKPLHYENQFDVASGKYNLKVVFSSGGASFGKLEMPLQVDPYEPADFLISGLALSKQARRAADLGTTLDASLLEDKVPLMFGNLQIVPSGSNEFQKGEQPIFYAEIYEPLLANPDAQTTLAVAIEMRILDRKTGEQKEDTGLMRLDLPKNAGSPVIPLGEKIPVENLAPGSYQLELSALDTANKQFKRV